MGETSERIGPYRVLRRLGVGGMAETFEALREHARGVSQRVCIKRVLPAYIDDADLIRLFELESRTMSGLAHGNIVGVLDVGTHEGTPYLVLELVDGIDLRALLTTAPSRRIDSDVARYIAYELAVALAYAHTPDPPRREHGVVHRDLSPSNVLVARGGEVRLTDFGLAKSIASHPVTQSGAVRGKIPYMAPEHMRGAPIDGRADLFSLGVMLFECLAGVRPFDGTHEVETMTRILAGTRTDLASLRPDLDPRLVALVERLLEADRDARFPDASAVAAALEAIGPIRRSRLALARLVESRLGGARTRAHVNPGLYFADDPPRVVPEPSEPEEVATMHAKRARAPLASASPEVTAHDDALHAMLERTADGTAPRVVEAPARPSSPPRKNRAALAGALTLVSVTALAGLVYGVRTSNGAESSEREQVATARAQSASVERPPAEPAPAVPAPPAVPSEAPTAPTETPVANAPVADAPVTDAPADANAPGETVVRIVIEPWGKVWVDRRYVGRAPRIVPLEPGSHLIEAGFDGRTHRQTITLAQGEHRTIRLDITPRE